MPLAIRACLAGDIGSMPLKRTTLERQLAAAREDLDARVKKLDEQGVEPKARRKDPKWRHFDAKCRQLVSRLSAVAAVEQREVDCAERKAGAASE